MLGLASTVSSSSTPESLYSIALDGADDYIGTGATFNTTFAGDFSISMWVKPTWNTGETHHLFGSINTSYNDTIQGYITTAGKLIFILKAHNGTEAKVTTDSAVFSSGAATSWTHLGFMANITGTGSTKTALHVYVNGSQVDVTKNTDNLTAALHLQWESDQNLSIGGVNNQGTLTTNTLEGKIDEVSIWNTKLDDSNFLAVYNSGRPTNLNINSGNYIKAASLQAYYRMGNGSFDDKANGVIHDQNTSNIVYNGNFEVTSGATGATTAILDWADDTDTDPDYWAVSGGVASIGARESDISTLFQNCYTIGKTYKTKLDVVRTAGTLTVKTGTSGDSLTITSSGTYEFSGVADANASLKIIAAAAFAGSVDNIDVREVGGGHGFGAELVTNGHFDTNVSGWTNNLSGDSTITQGSFGGRDGVARVVIDTNGQGDRFEHDITWEKDCLYYFSVDVYLLSGKFRIDGDDDDIVGVGSNSSYTSTNVLGTITYDASVDDRWRTLTGYAKGGQTGGTDEIWIRSSSVAAEFYIDNLSVRKLNGNPALTSNTDVPTAFSSDTP